MAILNEEDILEERILDFTAQQRAIKRSKVSTASRLNQDLGMDGDDAVEFFKLYSKEFRVDLDNLYTHWDQHFGPEGGPSFGFLVIAVLCIIAGFWLRDLAGLLPPWVWGIGLIAAAIVAYNLWFARKVVPITVGDLVESARSGRWNKPYSS
jgi:acyl carrier protein